MQTVTSTSPPTAAKTTVKKRKRANEAERRKAQTTLTVEHYDILVELLSPADASKRASFAAVAREWKNQCQLECSNNWLRDRVRTRWQAMTRVGAARRTKPRAMRARLDPKIWGLHNNHRYRRLIFRQQRHPRCGGSDGELSCAQEWKKRISPRGSKDSVGLFRGSPRIHGTDVCLLNLLTRTMQRQRNYY